MSDGLLVEVLTMTRGSATTAALSAAETTIPVEDITDFDATGGQVEIADVVYDYTAIDEDADTITLASGLTGAVAEFEPVLVRVGNKIAVDYYAEVHQDEGEGEPILVPLRKREVRLAWPVKVYDPPLPVNLSPDLSEITEADGVEPEMDGAYIDPTTLPDQQAIEVPASSPAVTVTGLADAIHLETEPIASTTLLTYQVSLDGSAWDDLNDVPVRSVGAVVKTLPDGSPLEVDTLYYFRTIAENNVGAASPSAAATGQLDPSAVELIASKLITAEVHTGFALVSGSIHVGGDAFTLDVVGEEANPSGGLRILKTNGDITHLTADGSPDRLSGNAVLGGLEVTETARLGGEISVFGNVTMAASDVPDPTVAPTVSTNYVDLQLAVSQPFGLTLATGGGYATISDGQLVTVSNLGAFVASTSVPLNTVGVVWVGTAFYVLHWRPDSNDFAVTEYDDTTLALLATTALAGTTSTRGNRAQIGAGPSGNLVVGIEPHDGTDWAGDVTMTRYDPSGYSVVSTIDLPSVGLIGGVYYGSGAGEFAADRWVLHPRNDDVQVFNTSGVRQTGEEWPRPYGKTVRGFYGESGDCLDASGVVRQLAPSADAPSATYWWSYAWIDADTHTTLCSPETSHARPKRARIRVACSPAPQQEAAGTHVANAIELFAATSSGGTKNTQGTAGLSVGATAENLIEVDTSAGGAPGSNNWAGVSPTIAWSAEAGGWTVDGESDGDIGTGTFRDSVDARVTALAQPLDSDLTAIAALSTTAFGRSLLTAADAAAARATTLAAPLRKTINAQTGTSYTLVLGDEGSVVQVNNAATHTLTVPDNATVAFPAGAEIEVFRQGAGGVTISPAAGVSIESRSSFVTISARYGVVRLRKRTTNTWVLSGDLA